jgi:AKAP7 2'5' RNA ligase-like domain
MLDLNDPIKLETAKKIADNLKADLLDNGILNSNGLNLNFDGIHTFEDQRPTTLNPKVFFIKIKEDENFEKLKKVSNLIITKCIQNNLINLGDKGNYRFHLSIVDNDFSH